MSGKTFYICSYGGCGSRLLWDKLKKYGKVEHVHSRKPPQKLQYIGGKDTYWEWFNGENVPDKMIKNIYVIYIYKNPIKAILSKFRIPLHLEHIQVDKTVKLDDVIKKEKDLYNIKEFYHNYTDKNLKRNYDIICVKYEELFEKQEELCKLLGIPKLGLVKKETNREKEMEIYNEPLMKIYGDLIDEMNKNDFIFLS